jgi:hypothetical protein
MSSAAQQVQQACQVLAAFLESLRLANCGQAQVTPADLEDTFLEIARVGEVVQTRVDGDLDSELENALCEYRGLLERVRQNMPLLHGRLLTERARLEAQRAHLEAANFWAETSRTTR